MSDEVVVDTRLQDALSPETRLARKSLLAFSAIGVAVVKVGLLPSKISALGIEFDKLNQKSFAGLLAVISFYFLITFLSYALSDFLLWKSNKRQLEISFYTKNLLPSFYALGGVYRLSKLSGAVSWLRCILDFFVPIIVSGYAIFILCNLVANIP